ncbi:DUF6400 family protein [Streptomyces sp. ID05-04B]|uniref:DUF6400 family protein n=1 Tax=unclassified Streptomyces TaxID=2593676 RepID=UPI000D1AEAF1|nr:MULTISPECIES: DUF6400 family protein [unclassified Streptomyces]AVV44071.1 hypothetical protein C6376_24100 [Streptomyces sp. P3]MDX5564524.1 DUF6400 family protein [Streptomyces sp. ID05-04B]
MSSDGVALPAEPDEPAETRGPAADRPGASAPVALDIDLSSHEMLRRAHVMDALGPAWDPLAALRGEEAAYDLLYSGLSAEQQRVYDELVSAGVLPRRGGGHAAA